MTRRPITALAAALATSVALGSIGLAGGMAAAATEPTLSVTRDCESYRELGGEGIHIRLTGLPPSTAFSWRLNRSNNSSVGAWPQPLRPGTSDANGNWESSGLGGISEHAIWTVTIFWSGNTLTESIYVDCTQPDGAVTVIPPADYSPGCSPAGEALQGHERHDTIDGSQRPDLLRGGSGDDSLIGYGRGHDCLFGQHGADAISGDGRADHIWGQRGADQLSGGRYDDWIRGGRGNDTIRGGEGNDHILDTHDRNRISCGKGIDNVKTIAKSEVAPNCEHVRIRRDFDKPRKTAAGLREYAVTRG
jgi:RTX calcium-binding nonapeptide repeat (4 copies)